MNLKEFLLNQSEVLFAVFSKQTLIFWQKHCAIFDNIPFSQFLNIRCWWYSYVSVIKAASSTTCWPVGGNLLVVVVRPYSGHQSDLHCQLLTCTAALNWKTNTHSRVESNIFYEWSITTGRTMRPKYPSRTYSRTSAGLQYSSRLVHRYIIGLSHRGWPCRAAEAGGLASSSCLRCVVVANAMRCRYF